jgi:hypothetical protein
VNITGSYDGIHIVTGATGVQHIINNQLTDAGGYAIYCEDETTPVFAANNRIARTSGVTGGTDWLAGTSFGHITTDQAGATTADQKAAEYVSPGSSNYDYRLKPASYGLGAAVWSGDCGACQSVITLPAAADVWHDTGTYGYAGSLLTPSKVGSSITNLSVGNVKLGVRIDDVQGTYDPVDMGDAVWPDDDYVHLDAGAYGPDGNNYTPQKSLLTNWMEKSALPSASLVKYPTDRGDGTLGTLLVPGCLHGPGVLSKDLANGVDGGACAKIVPSSTSAFCLLDWPVGPVLSTKPFNITFSYKTTPGFNGGMKVTIYDTDGSTKLLDADVVSVDNDGEYHTLEYGPYTASSDGGCIVAIEVKQGTHNANDAVYLSNGIYAV